MHICREFAKFPIYVLYPESFSVKNLAVRKVFAFSESGTCTVLSFWSWESMDWLQLVTIISIMAMPAQTWPLLNLCFCEFVFKGVLISINSLWTCNRLLDNSIFLKNKDDISSLKCQLEDQSQLLRSLSDHFQEGYIWPLHWPPSIFTTFNVSSQLQTSCRLHFREEAVVGTASVYEEKRGCDKSPTSLCYHLATDEKSFCAQKSHSSDGKRRRSKSSTSRAKQVGIHSSIIEMQMN